MFEIIAQTTTGNELGITAIVTSVGGLILAVLSLYWTKGSVARINEYKAKAEVAALDVKKIKDDCAKEIAEVQAAAMASEAKLQAHIDIIDRKLDAAEGRERQCLERAAKMEGKLEVMEKAQNVVSQKVEALEQKA